MVAAHQTEHNESYSEFRVHAKGSMLVRGKPSKHDLLHTFESQLPICVDLSFVTTKSVPVGDHPNRVRSVKIARKIEEMQPQSKGRRVVAKDFVKEMLGDVADFL
jgi:hypothetical protein